ncbi:MAG: DNA polymerase III subunit delta [Ignavibacteriales bacterium]|nr:DNA polymerase III subunit delta [Ignavibacteriales bacterium]
MAKKELPSITEIAKFLSKENFLPIYFLCGEDQYTIDLAVETLEKAVTPHLLSDFDKEIISADKNLSLTQVLDLAYSFPFGGGKKLIILKNFEKIGDKKELVSYVNSPSEFTVLIVIQFGKISDISKEPYSILLEKKKLFEARIATGEELVDWVVKKTKKLGINFSQDNARALIEIVGEDKSLLEMQFQKIINYMNGKNEITYDDIKKISSPTKEYSIFDLQDSLGKGDKSRSIEVAYNLLDAGVEIVFIINMLAKFVLTVAQITDLVRSKVNDNEAVKLVGVSWGYYFNCKKAKYLMSDDRLLNASRALLNADLAVKTTATDYHTVLLMLICEILGEEVTSSIVS